MSRVAARFTQAELARAVRVARDNGQRVEIAGGVIRLIDGPPAPDPQPEPETKVAPPREIIL